MEITFPRLAYKVGGPWVLECGRFSCMEVQSAEAFEALSKEGWYLTQEEAASPGEQPEQEAAQNQLEELRAKANALGIAFRPQWREKKLAEAIAEAEQAAA